MLWFWKPCRHWGTDVRHAFKGVALTGRLERLVERHPVTTVLNTAFPNHKIGFHNSFHSSPICLGLTPHAISVSTLHWRLNSLCNQQADSWLVVDSRLESQDYVARCGCQKSSYSFAAWRRSSWEQSSPGWLLWTRPLVLQLNPCFKIGRVSESSLRPLLWQAKLDHLIHAVFLHWAIAMQASRQKDLRGDISWVHSVLQWSHIRVRRVAKIDHFWGVLIPSRLLYSLLLCPWRIKHGLCRCMNGGT